jgi:hypothetical protein
MFDLLVRFIIAIAVYFLLLSTVEIKYNFRHRFQEKFITEENKLKVFALAFIIIVIGFSFVSVFSDVIFAGTGNIIRVVDGVKLGLLVYVINIVNPYFEPREEE